MPPFQKILCPTDLSEASYEGLKKAVELSSDTSEICVLHVAPPAEAVSPVAGYVPDVHDEEARQNATLENLRAILKERVPQNVRTKPLAKKGEAADEIVRAAYEEEADLLVLTAHGARGFRCGELGLVAEAVLQSAPCPVLVINGPTSGQGSCDIAHAKEILAQRTGAMRPAIETVHSSEKALFLDGD